MSKEEEYEPFMVVLFSKEGVLYAGIKAYWPITGSGINKLANSFFYEYTAGGYLKEALQKSNGRLAVLYSAEFDLEEEKATKALLEKYNQRKLSFFEKILGSTPLKISFLDASKIKAQVNVADDRYEISFYYDETAVSNTSTEVSAPKSQEVIFEETSAPDNFLLKTITYDYIGPIFVKANDREFIFASFSSIDEAEKIKKEWTRKMYVLHTPNLCLDGYYSTDEKVKNQLSGIIHDFESLMDREFEDAKSNLYRIPETASDSILDEIYDILKVDYFKIIESKGSKTGKFGVLFNYNFWGDWIFDIVYYSDSFEKTEFENYEDAYEMGIVLTQFNWTSKHGENPVFCRRDCKQITKNITEIEALIKAEDGLMVNKDNSIGIGMASIENLKKLEKILLVKPFHVIET